jgi:outer membrane protein assembly factor BamA
VEFNAYDADYLAEENYDRFIQVGLENTDYSGGRVVFYLNGAIGRQDRITLGFDKTTTWAGQYGIQVGYNHYDSRLEPDGRIEKGWLKFYFSKKWRHLELKWWTEFDRLYLDTQAGKKTDDFWRTGVKTDLDLRDNPRFPQRGIHLLVAGYGTWNNSVKSCDALDLKLGLFSRGLRRPHAIALYLKSHLTQGLVPIYDKLSNGGYMTIRGLKPYEDLSDQGVWGTLEYRIPLGNFNPSGPLLFASSLYLFADAGLFADKVKDFKDSKLLHSAGLGFLWQLRGDKVFRFDLVLTPKLRFVITSGWKF